VEWGRAELPMNMQAELLSLNRSGLYYKAVEPTATEVAIKHRIDEIYTAYPFYGSRRITAVLKREGELINRKRVQRHMQEMGIIAIYPGPNLSKRELADRIYPYLLRNVKASYPNHVWGIEITYIRLNAGWMYLVAIIDWYSRFIISWALDQSLELPFVLEAVDKAFERAKPLIFNSDQGSHFTSLEYIDRLKANNVDISMDSKGRAIDNIFTERFWRSIKYEEVYLNDYASPREARIGIARYVDLYNYHRPHQSLGDRFPAELYFH
jgi:putative transposase